MTILWQYVILILSLSNWLGAERVNLSCEQIRHFVDGHNTRRQRVAQGTIPGQPAASDMGYMVWDAELAEKATRWAETGLFGHNPNRAVDSNRWSLVGENIYMANFYSSVDIPVIPNIEEALETWFNEYINYRLAPFSLDMIKPFGHYTQMAWADSTHLGCGISQKKEYGWTTTYFVCDYGPTGNFIDKVPYTSTNVQGYLQCKESECSKPYGSYC
ncbi:venom allergen 5 2-like [Aphomia sociella]